MPAPAEASAVPTGQGVPAEDKPPDRHARPRDPHGKQGDRGERSQRGSRPYRPDRGERFDHGARPERGPRTERQPRRERGERPDHDPALRAKYIKGRTQGGGDRRDKAPDPDSPFAKLAALKEQLEADAKERRS
jgi:ATP-dependent RNA helicase SUPV3L1/SUV3